MRLALAAIAILALIFFLKGQFPYAAQSGDEKMRMLYLIALLALIGSGFLHSRNYPTGHVVKIALIWLVIILALVLGYSYRDMFLDNRLMAELMPQRARVSEDGSLTVRSDESGHFYIEAQVNNVPVKFLVDTGASNIVLSPSDAARAGFEVETLNYSRVFMTANGRGKGAAVKLGSLTVGRIHLTDVPASVNGAPMEESLLGMDFLNLLRAYRVEGNTLTLVP